METLVGKDIYTQLAMLLEYPREDFKDRVEEALHVIRVSSRCPEDIRTSIEDFRKVIEDMPLDDLQGIYSYTFELTSDYTLDLGAHVFDGFKRAEFLVNLKTMYRRSEFPFEALGKGELPDHLSLVLRFLGFARDEELKKSFKRDFLIKALEKLSKNFAKNRENPYYHLINAVYKIIDRDVKEVK